MHYFCGGVGTRALDLTQKDIDGAVSMYGPPLGQFRFYPEV
jgi:hypothetical protein